MWCVACRHSLYATGARVVMLLTSIRQVTCFDLGWDAEYSEVLGFPQSLQVTAGIKKLKAIPVIGREGP
jgi:hypothetical protein